MQGKDLLEDEYCCRIFAGGRLKFVGTFYGSEVDAYQQCYDKFKEYNPESPDVKEPGDRIQFSKGSCDGFDIKKNQSSNDRTDSLG